MQKLLSPGSAGRQYSYVPVSFALTAVAVSGPSFLTYAPASRFDELSETPVMCRRRPASGTGFVPPALTLVFCACTTTVPPTTVRRDPFATTRRFV